jgi:phosphoribosyl-AMP cyclohydrolase
MFSPRTDKKTIEEGLSFAPKFDKDGLIVAIAQDAATGEVLMVAYMNEESLKLTLQLGEAVYYSRSRQEIWHKGKTSGHVQKVAQILTDCDQDALVIKVQQLGEGACHTGFRSCFYRSVLRDGQLQPAIAEKAYDAAKVYGTGAK